LIDFFDRISELSGKYFVDGNDVGSCCSGVDTLTVLGASSVKDYQNNLRENE
jgi:hypothetical protein